MALEVYTKKFAFSQLGFISRKEMEYLYKDSGRFDKMLAYQERQFLNEMNQKTIPTRDSVDSQVSWEGAVGNSLKNIVMQSINMGMHPIDTVEAMLNYNNYILTDEDYKKINDKFTAVGNGDRQATADAMMGIFFTLVSKKSAEGTSHSPQMNGFSIESPKSTNTKLENGVKITDSNGGRGYMTDLPASKGSYSGYSTSIPNKADPETVRALTRENESPHILIENGFDVEQNSNIPETPKNPDYKINGYIYDNYAPKTSNTRAIWSAVENKVEAGQTNNVVINLADSKASTDSVVKQFNEYSIKGLGNILIIDNNSKVINLGWKEK